MRHPLPRPRLLVIGDRALAAGGLAAAFAGALAGGCRWLMVREKDLDSDALEAIARRVLALARPYGACVSINGDAALAARLDAGGVHLPQSGDVVRDLAAARSAVGETRLVGVSAHSLDEAMTAAAAGADYVTLSPIYVTETKPGYGPALGLATLSAIARAIAIPVIALGGVGPAQAAECRRAGAAGIAVMGAVLRSPDAAAAARRLVAAWQD